MKRERERERKEREKGGADKKRGMGFVCVDQFRGERGKITFFGWLH